MEAAGVPVCILKYRVPYSDCTVGNHVYYARYLEWLERGRNEFFRQRGVPFGSLVVQGILLPVVTCHVEFKAAARYDDEVAIETRLTEVGKVRLTFDYTLQRETDPQLLLTATTVHVCTDLEDKPRRLPEAMVRALRAP